MVKPAAGLGELEVAASGRRPMDASRAAGGGVLSALLLPGQDRFRRLLAAVPTQKPMRTGGDAAAVAVLHSWRSFSGNQPQKRIKRRRD